MIVYKNHSLIIIDMKSISKRIVIIGAGPGGLCMAKRLLDEGINNFVIIEREKDVGGVWYANSYPGCGCNTPGILYSFSFEPNPNWSNFYATQPEILEYMRRVADKYGLRAHCRFGQAVTRAEWDDKVLIWTLTLDSGESITADLVISAVGMFNEARWPTIDGLDTYKGSIWHTTDWHADHDLSHDSVAVVGNGDSATQLIPEIIKKAPKVYLFQRTPNYVLPKLNDPFPPGRFKKILKDPNLYKETRADLEHNINTFIDRNDPLYAGSFESLSLKAMEVVRSPEVRRKLLPNYSLGPRRSFYSNDFYRSFNEDNLELITISITQIGSKSIVTEDGAEREVDTIIMATGYKPPKFLSTINVMGRHGLKIREAWREGPIAYLGIMISGFPNLFMIFGPNTYTGSVPIMIEAQVDYILKHIVHLSENGEASVEVKSDAMIQYDNYVQAALNRVPASRIKNVKDQRLWTGGNISMWPFTIAEYRRLSTKIEPSIFLTDKLKTKSQKPK
jgi:cation diffusion facilitator CzcD-associated flavoprotein CzcO